jgi:hypothetical protein
MNRIARIATSLTIAVLFLTVAASAQFNDQKTTADIPFEFSVGKTTLPAGQYVFLRTGANTLLIRDGQGRGLFTLVSDTESVPEVASSHSSLRFANVDGKRVLVELWSAQDGVGRELYRAHALLEEARYPALHGISAGKR